MSENYAGKFDDMFEFAERQEDLDAWINAKQEVYEERIIKQLLTRFGLGDRIREFKRVLKDDTGQESLNFFWFRTTFPDFPLKLDAISTVYSPTVAMSDLFKRMTSTAMYKQFDEFRNTLGEEGEGKPGAMGLIFPWAKLGNMILHTSGIIEPKGTRIVRPFENDHPTLYMDVLNPFLDEVERIWKPD